MATVVVNNELVNKIIWVELGFNKVLLGIRAEVVKALEVVVVVVVVVVLG